MTTLAPVSVKSVVYGMFAQGGFSHQAIADKVRERIPHAQTSARSVASMAVDYRKAGGTTTQSADRGRVKRIVYALLAKKDLSLANRARLTHSRVAAIVRRIDPTCSTTDKSVASMAVDYRRSL